MGREIRRVAAGWEHPRYTEQDAPYANRIGAFRPLYDSGYQTRRSEWLEGLALWIRSEHPDQTDHPDATAGLDWWEWTDGPPRREDYRPDWTEAEATWWQAYETVSEGTPISPAFATDEELIGWLATNEDFWNQGPRTRESAERFVRGGWAPSAIFTAPSGLLMNTDALDFIAKHRE